MASLPEVRYRVVYVKLANLGARDMCRQVALGLGLPSTGTFPMLVRALEERLHTGFASQGLRQVIIFDDAHEMRPETLRLVRLLTNFDMDSKLVLSIILAGQLSLKKLLLSPDLVDVRQRLVSAGELRLFSRDETRAYIVHRVKIAGAPKSPFAPDAIDALFEITQGNMRALDTFAHASLKATAEAGRETVSASDVAHARAKLWT
jgi:general secretion pathway protein A